MDPHQVEPHRDGKPPWCKECGLTAEYKDPGQPFWKKDEESSADPTGQA